MAFPSIICMGYLHCLPLPEGPERWEGSQGLSPSPSQHAVIKLQRAWQLSASSCWWGLYVLQGLHGMCLSLMLQGVDDMQGAATSQKKLSQVE